MVVQQSGKISEMQDRLENLERSNGEKHLSSQRGRGEAGKKVVQRSKRGVAAAMGDEGECVETGERGQSCRGEEQEIDREQRKANEISREYLKNVPDALSV